MSAKELLFKTIFLLNQNYTIEIIAFKKYLESGNLQSEMQFNGFLKRLENNREQKLTHIAKSKY